MDIKKTVQMGGFQKYYIIFTQSLSKTDISGVINQLHLLSDTAFLGFFLLIGLSDFSSFIGLIDFLFSTATLSGKGSINFFCSANSSSKIFHFLLPMHLKFIDHFYQCFILKNTCDILFKKENIVRRKVS